MLSLILSVFGNTLAKIAFNFLENYLGKKQTDAESRKIFLELAKVLRASGVTSVQSRFEAEKQLDAGDAAWSEREKPSDK